MNIAGQCRLLIRTESTELRECLWVGQRKRQVGGEVSLNNSDQLRGRLWHLRASHYVGRTVVRAGAKAS